MGNIQQVALMVQVATALSLGCLGFVMPALATVVNCDSDQPVITDKSEVSSERLVAQDSESVKPWLLASYDPPKKGGPKRSGGSGTR